MKGIDRMRLSLSSLFNDERENLRGKVIGVYVLLFALNVGAWGWLLRG